MQTKRVFVLGPEHAGNRWLCGLIRAHPEVSYCGFLSYPGRGAWWTPENAIEVASDGQQKWGDDIAVLVLVRDKSCVLASQKRSGSFRPALLEGLYAEDAYNAAYEKIYEDLTRVGNKSTIVSYECLVNLGRIYFEQILGWLGLSVHMPRGQLKYDWVSVKAEPEDGNAKYFRGE